MDYEQWGMDYLADAGKLKKRIDFLQKGFSKLTGEAEIDMFRRISMLRSMYLECLHTGHYLMERGKTYEAQQYQLRFNRKYAGIAGRQTGT